MIYFAVVERDELDEEKVVEAIYKSECSAYANMNMRKLPNLIFFIQVRKKSTRQSSVMVSKDFRGSLRTTTTCSERYFRPWPELLSWLPEFLVLIHGYNVSIASTIAMQFFSKM